MRSIEAKNFIDFLSVSLNTENSRIIFDWKSTCYEFFGKHKKTERW